MEMECGEILCWRYTGIVVRRGEAIVPRWTISQNSGDSRVVYREARESRPTGTAIDHPWGLIIRIADGEKCNTSKRVLLLPERFFRCGGSARPSTLDSRPRLRRDLWLGRRRALFSAA